MDSSLETSGSHVTNCGARASSVIVQRVAPERVEHFQELQREINAAAKACPGYQAIDVYPPFDPQQIEWVVVIHFDSHEHLQRWLDSPVRAEWVKRLRREIGDFRLKTLPSGFGAWFAGMVNGSETPLPPRWKMALTILLTLYPTVMLLTVFVGPHINPLGLAVSMVISNALSVSTLQWIVQPALNPLLGPWLRANDKQERAYSLSMLAVLLLLLGGMVFGFQLATG